MKFPQHVHSVTPGDGYPPLIRQADFSNVWWSQTCWLNTHGQYHLVMKYFLVSQGVQPFSVVRLKVFVTGSGGYGKRIVVLSVYNVSSLRPRRLTRYHRI